MQIKELSPRGRTIRLGGCLGWHKAVQLMRIEYTIKFLNVVYGESRPIYAAVSTSVAEPSLETSRAQPFRATPINQSVQKDIVTYGLGGPLPVRDSLMLADKMAPQERQKSTGHPGGSVD